MYHKNVISKARIFMQKLFLNIHIFMHSKIQKYAKKSLLCVKKNEHLITIKKYIM